MVPVGLLTPLTFTRHRLCSLGVFIFPVHIFFAMEGDNSEFMNFTEPPLKAFLKAHGQSVSGNEQELVARAIGCQELAARATGCQELVARATGCQELVARATGCQELVARATGCQELVARATGCQELVARATGCQELVARATGCQELVARATGCQNLYFCHALTIFQSARK